MGTHALLALLAWEGASELIQWGSPAAKSPLALANGVHWFRRKETIYIGSMSIDHGLD